jgi:hypothetical protein
MNVEAFGLHGGSPCFAGRAIAASWGQGDRANAATARGYRALSQATRQSGGRAALDRQIETKPATGNQSPAGRRRGLGAGIWENGSRSCEYSAQ